MKYGTGKNGMTSFANTTLNGALTAVAANTTKSKKTMKTNINDNAKSSATQKDKILEHLMSGKPITPLEALNLYGSLRLGARIADIRKEGYIVYREMVTDAKTGKRYAQYSM